MNNGQKQERFPKAFKLMLKWQKTTKLHCSFGSIMNKEVRTVLISEERKKQVRRKPQALKNIRSRTLWGERGEPHLRKIKGQTFILGEWGMCMHVCKV